MDRWFRTNFSSFLATAVLAVATLYFAERVFAPLAVAGLLSVVLGGAVKRVERLGFGRVRLGRVASVLVVAVGISAGFVGMGWIVANEGGELAERLPEYRRTLVARVREPINWFEHTARQMRDLATPTAEARPSQVEIVGGDSELVSFAAGWVGSVASLAARAGIVVVLLIFLLIERDALRDRVLRVVGRGDLRLAGSALREASERVARYLRSLAILNCGHGIAVGIGLALIGLPGALLFGLLAGLLRFIPYAGPLIAASAPLLLSVAVSDDWTMVLWVGLFLGALELVSNNFLEPWLYGTTVGLSPFAVILSAVFWAWLWGPIGLVLATPLTVCLAVMGRHVPGLETLAILLGDSEALQPFERLYERLLARDLDSAAALVAEQNRDSSAVETWDRTLIPALRLLERDRVSHQLEGEALAYAREAFDLWTGELPEPPALAPRALEPIAVRSAQILCAPAGAFADEIVSAALARLLESRGVASRATVRLLTSELVETIASEGTVMVCLSALDSRAATVRHWIKRLQTSCPGVSIVVGFWGEDAARVAQLRESLAGGPPLEVLTTLEAAVEVLAGRAALQPPEAARASA